MALLPANNPLVYSFGDSIAGVIHHNDGGSGSIKDNQHGYTKVGAGPHELLGILKRKLQDPKTLELMHQGVVALSPGTSNNPNQIKEIKEEIALLDKNHINFAVIGVRDGVPNAENLNKQLSQLSKGRFVDIRGLPSTDKENIHPSAINNQQVISAALSKPVLTQ